MSKHQLVQEIIDSGESVLSKEVLESFTHDHLCAIWNRIEAEKSLQKQLNKNK